jgi:dipeptide/tripeptide permease
MRVLWFGIGFLHGFITAGLGIVAAFFSVFAAGRWFLNRRGRAKTKPQLSTRFAVRIAAIAGSACLALVAIGYRLIRRL